MYDMKKTDKDNCSRIGQFCILNQGNGRDDKGSLFPLHDVFLNKTSYLHENFTRLMSALTVL